MEIILLQIAAASIEIWIYFIVFALILFLSSYKIRNKFAPKYLFTFQKPVEKLPEGIEERKKLAESNLWFLRSGDNDIHGGWTLTRDGFVIFPLKADEAAREKETASNDGKHFNINLFWIYTAKNQDWALYKFSGVWNSDPLRFISTEKQSPSTVLCPVFTKDGLTWESLSMDENQKAGSVSSGKKVFHGHPVLNEDGTLYGFVKEATEQNGGYVVTFDEVTQVLNALQITIK